MDGPVVAVDELSPPVPVAAVAWALLAVAPAPPAPPPPAEKASPQPTRAPGAMSRSAASGPRRADMGGSVANSGHSAKDLAAGGATESGSRRDGAAGGHAECLNFVLETRAARRAGPRHAMRIPASRDRAGRRSLPRAAWALGWALCVACGSPGARGPLPSPAPLPCAEGADAAPAGCGEAASEAWPGLDALGVDGHGAVATPPPEAAAGEQAPLPVDAPLRLFAVGTFERITLAPRWDAPTIGLFRAGQSVALRDRLPLSGPGISQCGLGWYGVEPRGYVCAGFSSTFDADDPRVRAAAEVLPDRAKSTGFSVGVSRGAPRYRRIPSEAEQRATERHLPPAEAASPDAPSPPPSNALLAFLERTAPPLVEPQEAYRGMRVAWARELSAAGRNWLLAPDMTLIPRDRVDPVPVPELPGIEVEPGTPGPFPVAFLWLREAPKLRIEGGEARATGELWPRHAFVPVTGERVRLGAKTYRETREGAYLDDELATILAPRGERPRAVGPADKWVEVRVTRGFLVAYVGAQPVFAVPISPGAAGLGPRGHVTPPGTFAVYTKALSWDMSGVERGQPWKVDEVPWVAFFKDNYALHGTWWHDDFGRPRSHGCVNLPAAAAKRLFDWLDPPLPEGWYLVSAYGREVPGTTVVIRP